MDNQATSRTGIKEGQTIMQRECKYCDNNQMVNMDKPDGSDKWIVTNLDGSYHKHVKFGSAPTTTTQTHLQQQPLQQQSHYQERQEAIAEAHEENIEASKRLSMSINRLAAAIEKYITGKDDHLEDEFK
jgi:hypothetical protein